MATAISQGATGNSYIDGLLGETRWNGSFTFSFPQSTTDYATGYPEADTGSAFAPVTLQQREATRAIMTGLTAQGATNVMLATNVNSFILAAVSESGGNGSGFNGLGDIRLGEANDPSTAYASLPNNDSDGRGGDIWFGTAFNYRDPVMGNYAYYTHIHELGHAMGLKHPHEAGGPAGAVLPSSADAVEWSIMSYRSYVGGPIADDNLGLTVGFWDFPQTFMMYDIQALQTMYGAYYGANSGNTTYSWSAVTGQTFINGVSQGTPGANRVFMTVWDGGGIDTYDMSNYSGGVTIDLTPGGSSITSEAQRGYLGAGNYATGNVYNSLLFNGNQSSMIENAIGGAGNDSIVGNDIANTLSGNAGDDTIKGAGGADILNGGDGADTLKGGGGADALNGDAGIDTVSYALSDAFVNVSLITGQGFGGEAESDSLIGIENLTGSGFADTLSGNDLDNILDGGDGDDSLKGSGGADHLDGGNGFDTATYRFSSAGVNVNLATGLNTGGEAQLDQLVNIENVSGSDFEDALTGNSQFNVLDGKFGNDTITDSGANTILGGDGDDTIINTFVSGGTWDGGAGYDTIDLSNDSFSALIDLSAAFFTAFGATFSNFENVVGTQGDDNITGSSSYNILKGHTGSDTIIDNDGTDDSVDGGSGIDLLVSDLAFADDALFNFLTGLATAGGTTFLHFANIENLIVGGGANITANNLNNIITLTETGGAHSNIVGGLGGNDQIFAGSGDDLINGGAGVDIMDGGVGNDQIYVDSSLDTVIEAAGGGNDRVFSYGSYFLQAGVEVETLTTTNQAGTLALSLSGNELGNLIGGNNGNNTLDGGSGIDTLRGFGGNDFYYVDTAGDVVVEAAGGGGDRVLASASYTLGAGQEIEILTTANAAGLAAISLTGNAFNQTIQGNAGANNLNGAGGADTMSGLGGNDQYYVDAAGDVVTEAAGGGSDRVFSAVSYALGAGQEIEIFTTTNTAGLGALNLTGNALSQTMHGNGGANVLNGGGGNDTMVGFGGNDQYYVDAAGDVVTEAAGGGSDRVFTAVSYTLGAGQEVEIFTTTNTAGAGAINLTGNAFNQTMHGNGGANVLNGGTGNDVISGFGGADIFVFNTALNAATNIDTITDFNAAADTIHLENAIFTLLTATGALAANLFKNLNLGAQDADDRILYNDTTGAVIYDANGLTGGGQTQFALLTGSPTVTDADFVVI